MALLQISIPAASTLNCKKSCTEREAVSQEPEYLAMPTAKGNVVLNNNMTQCQAMTELLLGWVVWPWSEWRREREGEDVYVSLADYSTVDLQAVKCLATQAVCLQGAFKGIPMLADSWITLIISKSIRRIDETMWQPIMHLDFNQFGIDHISEINKIMSHPVELFAACCSSLWFCLLEMLSLLC